LPVGRFSITPPSAILVRRYLPACRQVRVQKKITDLPVVHSNCENTSCWLRRFYWSHLGELLVKSGHQVIGIDNVPGSLWMKTPKDLQTCMTSASYSTLLSIILSKIETGLIRLTLAVNKNLYGKKYTDNRRRRFYRLEFVT